MIQMKVAFTVPQSEYKKTIEDLFQTTLTDEEAGGFIFKKKHEIQQGIYFDDPRRTIKEAIDVPQTITFLIVFGTGVVTGVASNVISSILFEKLKNCSWLKIGNQTCKFTLEDIRRIVREELERDKEEDESP